MKLIRVLADLDPSPASKIWTLGCLFSACLAALLCTLSAEAASSRCPGEVLLVSRFTDWDKVDLPGVFRALEAADIRLNRGAVTKKYSEQIHVILLQFKVNVQGPGFFMAMQKRFGSWPAALSAHGIDPAAHDKSPERQLTPEDIKKALHALFKAGVPLNSGSVRKDDSEKSRAIIKQAIGVDLTLKSFYTRTVYSGRAWPQVLDDAKLPTADIVKNTKGEDWSRDDLLKMIQLIAGKYDDLNLIALEEHNEDIRLLAYAQFKRKIGVTYLGKLARDEFGTWPDALKAAGLNADKIRWSTRSQSKLKSRTFIVHALKVLSKYYPDLDFYSLKNDGQNLISITFKEFGFAFGATALETAILDPAVFGTWEAALEEAGLLKKWKGTRSLKIQWSEELLHGVLYFLSQKRINLTLGEFMANSKRIQELTLKEYRTPIRPYSIFSAALSIDGGWYQALEAADVKVKAQRRDRVTSDIVLMPHVTSYESNADGSRRKVVEYGEVRNPEDELLAKETKEKITAAAETEDNQDAALALLEYLEEHEGLDDQKDVLNFLASATGRAWNADQLAALLNTLASGLSRDLLD